MPVIFLWCLGSWTSWHCCGNSDIPNRGISSTMSPRLKCGRWCRHFQDILICWCQMPKPIFLVGHREHIRSMFRIQQLVRGCSKNAKLRRIFLEVLQFCLNLRFGCFFLRICKGVRSEKEELSSSALSSLVMLALKQIFIVRWGLSCHLSPPCSCLLGNVVFLKAAVDSGSSSLIWT